MQHILLKLCRLHLQNVGAASENVANNATAFHKFEGNKDIVYLIMYTTMYHTLKME